MFEVACCIADIVEDGAGEAFGNRELIFEATDHQGALRQDGAVGAGQADAVEFVTAYGSCAPVRNIRLDGTSSPSWA